ncbi:alpha/beta hydrolase family protein [Actinoallomurus iriomotensis]|uniref:Esterase n=1 Tax=Actinoallomurus iriomotensis TaxID=478107 RepID=A0A9W6RQB5_9ACTN|nr:lipase [Actinoallomurus iriomotensis]GLY78010.1 esterase [Actinoallomurus iriomotensis]
MLIDNARKTLAALAAATLTTATPATATSSTADHAHGTAVSGQKATAPLYLPPPTGPHQVGTALLHLVDASRTDPLGDGKRPRELIVQLWYPAQDTTGHPVAPYMPPGEAAQLEADHHLPPGAITAATTNSHIDAPVAGVRHPVVLFYPGWCSDRTDTTFIDEELASRGFVVVATASTHEAAEVEFPRGRLVKDDAALCARGSDQDNDRLWNRLQAIRVRDTTFVLDQLSRISHGANPDAEHRPLPAGLARSLDLHRIGMFGHSLGGSTTAEAMHEDKRVRAGIDLDGLVIGPVQRAGLRRPFLVFGSGWHAPGDGGDQDPTWSVFLPRLRGWHHWLRLDGSGHYRFTDLAVNARAWGLDEQLPAEAWRLDFGDIDDHRAPTVVRAYTAAFFERFLTHQSAPILDHPSPAYPEIEFMR